MNNTDFDTLNKQLIDHDIPLQVLHMEKADTKPVITKPNELTGAALANYKRQLQQDKELV